MSTTRGLTAKGVPVQPAWLIIIKGVIVFLSLIILALSAYAISLTGGYGFVYYGSGAPGFMIFIVVKTLIIFGGLFALERFAPHAYYRLLAIIAYALSIVFWLSGWAWCASWAAAYLSISDYYGIGTYDNWAKKEGGALAGAAGLGAITWVLCIVHLAFFIQACMRSPEGDMPVAGGMAPAGYSTGNAELGNMQKQEGNVSAQPYPVQPQQAMPYGAPQPVYGVPQQQPYGAPQGHYVQQPYQQ